MVNVFKNTDIGSVPLIEYVSWFLEEDKPNYNIIQLPPIQRNSVWRVSQIEKLWDSLLRGFPIGSFLLSSREKGARVFCNATVISFRFRARYGFS